MYEIVVILKGAHDLIAIEPAADKYGAAATQKHNSDDSDDEGGIVFPGLFRGRCNRCFHGFLQK